MCLGLCFVFKQKTAYEMRISDWSSDVCSSDLFAQNYADVFKGDSRWNDIQSPDTLAYQWDEASTYIKNPPYFEGMTMDVGAIADLHGARVLGLFGDSITTDHISPAGNIKHDSPAGKFLQSRGVPPADFNSYGSRRGKIGRAHAWTPVTNAHPV